MTEIMKRVENPSDVPVGRHYAVIEFHEVTEDSGWGSENNYRVLCPHYYVTEDRNVWEWHIRACEHDRRKYVAMTVESKATIDRPVVIS